MKILLTTDTFYPMVNGVVISTQNLYKELKLMGHDVKILALSADGKERIDGDIFYLKSFNLKLYPGAKVKRFFNTEIRQQILKWRPDIIHSQTEFSTMIDAKFIAKILKVPQIHTYHTMYEDYLDYFFNGKILSPKGMGMFIRFLLNSMEAVIAPTNKVKTALLNYGVKRDIHIIPTGIDLSKFQISMTMEEKIGLRKRYNIDKKDKILLYLGRIAQEKNIEEIVDAYSNLADKIDNFKLLIVGGGPYLENLKELSSVKALKNKIIFTGMVKPEEVYKYYKISDAFVTASTSETQGLTYIEALSSGLPVICRYDPCIEGVVEPYKNGLVYKTSKEFEEAIENLFTDEALRLKMAKYSESFAEKFSSRTFSRRVELLYAEILNSYVLYSHGHSA